MAAVITIRQRYQNALYFLREPNKFISLGGQDEWEDDQNPGVATGNEISIPTPIIYKTVDVCKFAKVDPNGEFEYSGVKFSLTDDEQLAKDYGYTYVYVEASFYKNMAPIDKTFRVVGVHTNVDAEVDENGYSYPSTVDGVPNVVSSEGLLAVIDYRKPVSRHDDQIEKASVMIEF